MSHIITKSKNKYSFHNAQKVTVPHFNTYYRKNSIAYKGPVNWNVAGLNDTVTNVLIFGKRIPVKKINILTCIKFDAESVQTAPRHNDSFKFY